MAAYGEKQEELDELGVRVVALTSDDAGEARGMKEDEGLDLAVAHSVALDDAEERLGLYVHRGEDKQHLQPAAFILCPDGTVDLACYTSGPVGRLDAGEAVERIRSRQEG